jgi:hypothetical protein
VDDLQRRFLRPVVVLLDAETFGGVHGAEKLMKSLHERHVPVVTIKCDADLTQALSIVPATINTKDMRPWQSPVLSQ